MKKTKKQNKLESTVPNPGPEEYETTSYAGVCYGCNQPFFRGDRIKLVVLSGTKTRVGLHISCCLN